MNIIYNIELVVWHSSNTFHSINKLTLHRAGGLVLGWVWQVNHLGM